MIKSPISVVLSTLNRLFGCFFPPSQNPLRTVCSLGGAFLSAAPFSEGTLQWDALEPLSLLHTHVSYPPLLAFSVFLPLLHLSKSRMAI